MSFKVISQCAKAKRCYKIKEYNKIENNIFDTFNDKTAKTANRQEYKKSRHNLQIVFHLEEEKNTNKSQLIDIRVFKLTSKNTTKLLKMRQDIYGTIKVGKTLKTTLKQIATQKFPTKNRKIEI